MSDSPAPHHLHYEAAIKVADILNRHGFEAYIVGGAVRDIMLGRIPKDYDLVTNATPEQILRLPEINKSRFKDTSQAFGVTRVFMPIKTKYGQIESEIEVATYRRDIEAHLGRKATKIEFANLEDDVLRRDFTVNALAFDPATMQVIDYVGGIDDLHGKLIRFIGEPAQRIKEDPLRILRGIRLRNQLGFEYEPVTLNAIKAAINKGTLKQIAVDRIRGELTSMLVHNTRCNAIEDLDRLGIIKRLLPEIAAMKGVIQPAQFHQEGDVWTHTLLAMKALPNQPSPRLAWGTLLHDVGKPPTLMLPEETRDRVRFNNHAQIGAQMAVKILKRFNFPKLFISDVAWMIEYHLGIDDLPKMRPGHRKYILSHPAFPDLLELHRADATAAWNLLPDGTIDKTPPDFTQLEALWREYQEQTASQKHAPSLKKDLGIDGRWLMSNYHLQPGKQLGWIVNKLQRAYDDGLIDSQETARKYVNRLLRKP